MESRKRLFIAFSITMILLVALFTSFGRSFFISSTPSVTLPSLGNPTEESGVLLEESNLQRIEITPDTVQAVVASLQSNPQYRRNFTTTLYWGEESVKTYVEVWAVGAVSQVKKILPSELVRFELITETQVYSWYDGEETYQILKKTDYAQDISQMIPSYEMILALEPEHITNATYEYRHQVPCIYIEGKMPPLGFTQCFWVDAESGLLIAAEIYDAQTLIYAMEGFSPLEPYDNHQFYLPDGKLLTEVEGA
ncbi:MAG: hypothetical protein R3Y63_00720 [Eubacteriales bacterium]